jgi:hypothetical protein
MALHNERVDQGLSAPWRVIRATDLHSRQLVQSHGLTGPQALVLEALVDGRLSAGALAGQISLSQGTVTDIGKNKRPFSLGPSLGQSRMVLT